MPDTKNVRRLKEEHGTELSPSEEAEQAEEDFVLEQIEEVKDGMRLAAGRLLAEVPLSAVREVLEREMRGFLHCPTARNLARMRTLIAEYTNEWLALYPKRREESRQFWAGEALPLSPVPDEF